MGYKIRYRQSVTDGGSTIQDEKTIDTFDCVWNISPLNTPWVASGCYAGATPTNGSDIGTYSVATWSGWNKDSVYSDMRDMSIKPYAGSSQQNLRFMAKYNNGSYDVNRQYFNWTNLRDNTVSVVSEAIANLTNYVEYDPYRRQDKNVPVGGNSNSPLNVAPLESLQINNLIFMPIFIIKEIEYYNYDDVSGGYLSVLNPSGANYYTWADLKPEDKTEAGEHYDADLFERGWKEIDSVNEDGRRFRFCCGVILTPYYGKCSNSYTPSTDTYTSGTNPDDGKVYGDRQVLGSVVSQTDEYPKIGNTTNLNRPCLMVMTESYNTVTGGLTYSTPTGIMFDNFLQTSGNVSSSILALQPSWLLTSNFQTFTASSLWTSQFFINTKEYSNIYADVDPSASNAAPDLSIPTKIDIDINISHLYDIADLSGVLHYYIPNDNPIAFSFIKKSRSITATNCAFFSINALWHTIASLGCYVADSTTTAHKAPTGYYTGNNNHLYLGHMSDNGITDGIMLQGIDLQSSVQARIDDIIQNTPYTPITPQPPSPPSGEGIDDNEKGSGTNLPNFGLKLAGSGGFTSYYLLSYQGLASVQNALSVVPDTFWEALGTATDYSQSNLLKYVMSLKWYPIDILTGNQGVYADVATTEINFAFNQNSKLPITGVNYKLGSTLRVYNMGSISVPYKLNFETFLDKDPYTSVNIWLPFCGLYPLIADYVVGNTINIYYVIDLTTGMCTAIVTNDRNTLLNVTGKIGVDYAVTGNDVITQSERMAGSYVNGAMSVINGAISLGSSAMSENIAGAVSASVGLAGSIAKSSIDIASAKRAVPVAVSSGSGFGSCFAPNAPSIIVNPPAVKIPSDYGHTTGYVYNQIAVIGSLSGFVVCNNPDLTSIRSTDAEKAEIYRMLTSGFYV